MITGKKQTVVKNSKKTLDIITKSIKKISLWSWIKKQLQLATKPLVTDEKYTNHSDYSLETNKPLWLFIGQWLEKAKPL
jgi:hypothetical protein